MSLAQWMQTRKVILLHEKKNSLFNTLPESPDFHATRAALYETLSRLQEYQRVVSPSRAGDYGIRMVA